jgi:hypothetical protein
MGRFVISLALASAFVVAGVAVVNRGINDRVKSIQRVAGLKVAPAPPGGANYLIIGSDTRAFATDPGDQAAFGSPNVPTPPASARTRSWWRTSARLQQTFVVSFRATSRSVPGSRAEPDRRASGGLGRHRHPENFGIDISHYLEVDFRASGIVDTIGNVQVYLPGRVRDQETGLNTPCSGGCYRSTVPPRSPVRSAPHLRPERADRRPRHRGALAAARPAGRPLAGSPASGRSSAARRPRHLRA